MSRLQRFFPDYEAASVYDLSPDWFGERGFRGVILDIDNTLVSPNAPANAASCAFVAGLKKAGIACMVLSNNKRERAGSFAAMLGVPFLAKAKKPRPEGFWQGAELLGTGFKDTLVIGDQLFTDVYGAHRAGMKCLLVQALDPAHEQPFVRVKRVFEKLLRRFG